MTGATDFKQLVGELNRNAARLSPDAKKKAAQDILKAQDKASGRMTAFAVSGMDVFKASGFSGRDPQARLTMLHKNLPKDELTFEWQRACDDFYLTNFLLKAAGKGPLAKSSIVVQRLGHLTNELRKAMAGATTVGLEFMPRELSRSLIEFIRLELRVAALHDRVTMTSDVFDLPLEGADVLPYLAAEALTDNTSTESEKIGARTPATAKVTLDSQKLAVRTVWSSELDQDSIISVSDYVRRKLAQALANGVEDATINGDSAGAHMDSDVTAATDHRKAWNGYRNLALSAASVDGGNTAATLVNLRAVRRAMGKYGINPAKLAWVVGIKTYNDLMNISEVTTVEKYGSQATILTGELARVDGIPVIVSEFQREDLNATGVHDGITTNRTVAQLVHRDAFVYGDRLSVTVKSAEQIETDQLIVVTKQRVDFKPTQDATTQKIVGRLYNLAAA